jgi:hypothetical protein
VRRTELWRRGEASGETEASARSVRNLRCITKPRRKRARPTERSHPCVSCHRSPWYHASYQLYAPTRTSDHEVLYHRHASRQFYKRSRGTRSQTRVAPIIRTNTHKRSSADAILNPAHCPHPRAPHPRAHLRTPCLHTNALWPALRVVARVIRQPQAPCSCIAIPRLRPRLKYQGWRVLIITLHFYAAQRGTSPKLGDKWLAGRARLACLPGNQLGLAER